MRLPTMSAQDLPRRVAYQAYQFRRLLRPQTRSAYEIYRAGMRARQQNLQRSPDERAAWVLGALRGAARHAAALPFWRDRFAAVDLRWNEEFSFADFARVPVLERADIAEAGDALLHPSVPSGLRRKMATGGSSGTPTVTWTGPEERGWGESAAEFYEYEIGVRRGDRLAYLWGHNLDPVTRASRRERLEDWLFNRRWYDCFRLSPETLTSYHRDLQEFRPRVMICYASALASLAETIRDQGLDAPVYPTFGFITGAEKLYPAQRALIASVFGKPVYERYGGRDIGLVGCQLAPDAALAYDVDWSNVYVERESSTEETSIILSKLHADAMPLLRYRTGDVGRFAANAPGPIVRIEEVVGREIQRIWRHDGTWMHGTVVPHLLKDFALREYQLHQRDDYAVELLLVPQPAYRAGQDAEIRQALELNLPGLALTIRHVPEVPRTKAGKWLPVLTDVRR